MMSTPSSTLLSCHSKNLVSSPLQLLLLLFIVLLLTIAPAYSAFVPRPSRSARTTTTTTTIRPTKLLLFSSSSETNNKKVVEVCGFKDCKRAGGGPRLEKLINEILTEKGIDESQIQVESCDCQGECGYGPNILVDGAIINEVKGREAVIKALGLEEDISA